MVCFDLLAADGEDLRPLPLAEHRARLERLLAGAAAPITLCQQTTDEAEAQTWLDTLSAGGIEGVVVKDRLVRYPARTGQRVWHKLKVRDSLDLVVVGTLGDPRAPSALLLARPTAQGLRPAGVTTVLARALARDFGRHLTVDPASAPRRAGWPGRTEPSSPVTGVLPVVVEVSADVAVDGGVLHHAARIVPLRPDLTVEDRDDR